MIKVLEQAIAKVRELPEDKQRIAAELLEELAATDEVYTPTSVERSAIRQGLADADRGDFISDEEANTILRRPWD